MKLLGQALLQGRGAARRVRSTLPGPLRVTVPTRLVLHLDDSGTPTDALVPRGEPLDLEGFQQIVTSFVTWLGPLRVVVVTEELSRCPWLIEIVRFANRLECPTQLVTGVGSYDDRDRIDALVGAGMAAITLRADPGDLTEGGLGDAISDVCVSRREWSRRVAVLVAVALDSPVASPQEVAELSTWVRARGVDGIVGTLEPGRKPSPGALAALDAIGEGDCTHPSLVALLRGQKRRGLPVGPGAQVWLDGTLGLHASAPPVGVVGRDPEGVWERGVAGGQLPSGLERPSNELLIVPRMLVSRR